MFLAFVHTLPVSLHPQLAYFTTNAEGNIVGAGTLNADIRDLLLLLRTATKTCSPETPSLSPCFRHITPGALEEFDIITGSSPDKFYGA